jgi:SAM-dependent methyltransferase/uncharacterized protein YbaR (Trm112 family)
MSVHKMNKLDAVSASSDTIDFWCPCCHGKQLQSSTAGLHCSACGQHFSITQDVPVLINDTNSVFEASDYIFKGSYVGASYGSDEDLTKGFRGMYRRTVARISEPGVATSEMNADKAIDAVCSFVSNPRILVIGAGVKRYGQRARIVYSDVAFSKGIHVIADAHDLPFSDQVFDLVIAIAVLEHVADPYRVVREIHRTLKTEGSVYAVTPFMQPVHMGAYDFTRFTHLGHRRLFRYFSETSSGMALGPGSVVGSSLKALAVSLTSSRNLRRILNLLGILLAVPFKWLDHVTKKSPFAIDGAGGVYFFGKKAEIPISDRELISLYRGGQ